MTEMKMMTMPDYFARPHPHFRMKVEIAVLGAIKRPFLFPAERTLLHRIIDEHTRTQVQSIARLHRQTSGPAAGLFTPFFFSFTFFFRRQNYFLDVIKHRN